MKRLNKKGFTLVELLAVIVILAIVVGITLVTVLPTLNDSKLKALETSAQTAADYYEKQYQLYLLGQDSIFDGTNLSGEISDYAAAGLKADNFVLGTYTVNTTTTRACVTLTPNTTAGDYKGITLGTDSTTGEEITTVKSSAC